MSSEDEQIVVREVAVSDHETRSLVKQAGVDPEKYELVEVCHAYTSPRDSFSGTSFHYHLFFRLKE